MKCIVQAKTIINPTEDLDRVISALSNLFDYDDLEIGDDYVLISGKKSSLLKIKDSLEKMQIRDTARKVLLKGVKDKKITFGLNKQVALVGRVNFSMDETSPLGDIEVKMETNEPERLIDWLCEKELV